MRNAGFSDVIFFLGTKLATANCDELIIWDYVTEKDAERPNLLKKLHFEKECYFSFFAYFLPHTWTHTQTPLKNVHVTPEENADDQTFLFHIVLIFFVEKKNPQKACSHQLSLSPLP